MAHFSLPWLIVDVVMFGLFSGLFFKDKTNRGWWAVVALIWLINTCGQLYLLSRA